MAKVKDKEKESRPWDDIGIGDQVKHPVWGNGTVLFRSGSVDGAKAIVVFPEEGQKKLSLKYAKLKKIGSAPKSEVAAKIKAAVVEKPVAVAAEEEIDEKALLGPEEGIPFPEEAEADIFEDDEEEQFTDREKGGE